MKHTTDNHACKFFGHSRRAPAGGNQRNVSVLVSECRCGKIQPKFQDKLSYWDRRWIDRVNRRSEKHPQPTADAN